MNLPAEKSLEHRRRAVYTALIEHLDANELWEALAHWEDAYAGDLRFSSQRFLSDILVTPQLREKRVRILQSLVRAQSAPMANLLPDPREQLLVYRMRRGRASPVTSSRDPVVVAWCSLMSRMLHNLDNNNRLRMRLYILDQLERSGVASPVRAAIRVWLSEQSRLTLSAASEKDLRRLLNIAYIGLCEYVGPVAADAALNRAFTQLGDEEPDLLPHVRALL